MNLIFFDEVKPQPNYHHYHIGAICIDEIHLKNIETAVNSISKIVFNDIILSRSTEFHAQHIFSRSGLFKGMLNFYDRLDILVSLLQILSKPEVELINIQINTEKLYNSKQASDLAFMFLCERTNDLMKAKGSLGMLIGDREDNSITERFSGALSSYRCNGTQFEFKSEITHLFESVHFTPSHLSRFLQLADVYSWINQFKNRHRKDKTKYRTFFDMIAEKEIKLYPKKYKVWPQ